MADPAAESAPIGGTAPTLASTTAAAPGSGVRKPFTGSCHCGHTKFIAWLTLPHTPHGNNPPPKGAQRIYKCNCTPCHKFGILHVRPSNPTTNFLLLSPLDPVADLKDYRCNGGLLSWRFCPSCGGRCLSYVGRKGDASSGTSSETGGSLGSVEEVEVASLGLSDAQLASLDIDPIAQKTVKVFRFAEPRYLSVYGYALDAQDGLDLREWTEKKWVQYMDCLDELNDDYYDRPHRAGAY